MDEGVITGPYPLMEELSVLRQRKSELEQQLNGLQDSRKQLMVQLESLMKMIKVVFKISSSQIMQFITYDPSFVPSIPRISSYRPVLLRLRLLLQAVGKVLRSRPNLIKPSSPRQWIIPTVILTQVVLIGVKI
jgi:hypothetical protein